MTYKTIKDLSAHVHTMYIELRLKHFYKNLLYYACLAHT